MESRIKVYAMTLSWGNEQTQGSKVTEVKQDIGGKQTEYVPRLARASTSAARTVQYGSSEAV